MDKKIPIALLIGRGTRILKLFEALDRGQASFKIVNVISHKALDRDNNGNTADVPGILEAKKRGINSAYFNLVQMKKVAKETDPDLDEKAFRQKYFEFLGAYLCQNYPQRPQTVFMLGWDLVVPKEFLGFFPSVINLHPSQLPENPGEEVLRLSTGEEIPVLRGEHDEVIKEALARKLPAMGACMHFATEDADFGPVIKRAEVPILPGDSFESYDQRLLEAEEKMVLEVIELFCQGKIKLEGGKVKII